MLVRMAAMLSKGLQTIDAGEGEEKGEPSYTVGGNANQYSHYGEQCGDSLKNWKQNCHNTQKSQCWAYTPRKPELKETCVLQCSSQHSLQQLGHGSNLDVHQKTNGQESCGTYTQWNITQLLNTFESVLMRRMKLEPIIQSEISQKEKHLYSILTHLCGIQKDGNDDPICQIAKETQR